MKKPPIGDVEHRSKSTKWYHRLWILLSNPFTYIFKGRIRW